MLYRCCSLLVFTLAAAIAQPALPETPAGRVFRTWLEAFNSGDRGRLDAFYQKYQPSQSAEGMMPFRANTGGFELLAVDKSEPLHLEVRVKEHNSETTAVGRLDVTAADPPQVASLSIRAIPRGATMADFQIDTAARGRAIDGAISNLNEFYVFPEVARKMEDALRTHQKSGDYDAVTNGDTFAALLTTHLQEVSHDKHLRVNFNPMRMPPSPPEGNPGGDAQYRKQMERMNCGFEKVERFPNNVGYVKFNMFADPGVCGATASAAMNFIGNVDAVIFDLRDNGGGDPKMVAYISSYLFSKTTHLNDLWTRKGDTTQQFWTLESVPGKRLDTQSVYVLTSKRTFSGAEEFTYNLENLKRATIVGETTGGGAHPVSGHRIDDHFMIGVPFARAINPISKTNWEGTGVEPDVKTPAADALSTAQKLAAEKLKSK